MTSEYTPTEAETVDAVNEWVWHCRTWRPDIRIPDGNEGTRAVARIRADAVRAACDRAGRATRTGDNPFVALLDEADRIEKEAGL